MESIDPATGQPLPQDAIQRILFIANGLHVYQIPPRTSNKGYTAATWTSQGSGAQQIFTARLRILETAIPAPDVEAGETVKTDILLEDPSTGQLFAAAPYTNEGVVEQVLDSSRFFALTVQGGGRKAVLGIGFEERGEAFDFSVALQEARKTLGLDKAEPGPSKKAAAEKEKVAEKKDYSLKEGETITVNIGGRRGRRAEKSSEESSGASSGGFSLPPPPGASFLPPPPSTRELKAQRRRSQNPPVEQQSSATKDEFGFDDGEFGEFQ